jgi:hypothetical protein
VKKYVPALLAVLAAASILSCPSGPSAKTVSDAGSAAPEFRPRDVVEHKTSAAGQDVPRWVFEPRSGLESLAEYEDSYVFKFTRIGADLEELQDWMSSFPADQSIADAVVSRIRAKWDEAEFEGRDRAEPYLEEALRIVEAAEYAGTRRRDDHWIVPRIERKRRGPYHAYLLFTVPKAQVHSAIDRAMVNEERRNPPSAEEVRAALDWLRLLLSEGI